MSGLGLPLRCWIIIKVVGGRVRNEMPALCFIKQVQCHTYTGYCWCVTPDGKPISGSSVQNKTPVCSGTVGVASTNTYLITEGTGEIVSCSERLIFSGDLTSLPDLTPQLCLCLPVCLLAFGSCVGA